MFVRRRGGYSSIVLNCDQLGSFFTFWVDVCHKLVWSFWMGLLCSEDLAVGARDFLRLVVKMVLGFLCF